MNPFGTRTQDALKWLAESPAPGEPRRTQGRAAELFGISQPTIAGALARGRRACPTCGQRVKADAPAPADTLAAAIGKYAWHLADCGAYETGDGECSCGFAEVERVAAGMTPNA